MAIEPNLKERLRSDRAEALMTPAEEAAMLIKDGMAVGISGFTNAGYPKVVTHALAEQAKAGRTVKIDLYSGASVGPEVDTEYRINRPGKQDGYMNVNIDLDLTDL